MSFSTNHISIFKKIIMNLKDIFTKIKIKINNNFLELNGISNNNDLYTKIIFKKHFFNFLNNEKEMFIEIDIFDLYNIIKKITFRYDSLNISCNDPFQLNISAYSNNVITNNKIICIRKESSFLLKQYNINNNNLVIRSKTIGGALEKFVDIFDFIYFKIINNELIITGYNDMIEGNITLPIYKNNNMVFKKEKYNLMSLYSIIKLSYLIQNNIIYIKLYSSKLLLIEFDLYNYSRATFVIPNIIN